MRDLNAPQNWLATQTTAASQRLFVLADGAMDNRLIHALKHAGYPWTALLEHQGSNIAEQGPHLFEFGSASALQENAALRYAAPATFSALLAPISLTELHSHLQAFTMAQLEGGLKMGFAFWDPAILGSLVGQLDDSTLYLAGPVLDTTQLKAFLSPVTAWWYWDREGQPHRIDPPHLAPTAIPATGQLLQLTQVQEDQLVEASVPDQILYHLELNQPHLFDNRLPAIRRYRFVRAVLGPARSLGLSGMRDLVNFTAMCLIYRERMQTDPTIAMLLEQVREQQLTLDQAMEKMPE